MKEIKNYFAKKYADASYSCAEEGIYQTSSQGETLYVTSLSFVQEPELQEGDSAANLSQYPLEDLLDHFCCHISDFYEDLNTAESQICRLEFASPDLEDIRRLRFIIGKHVCNKEADGYSQQGYVQLIME